MVENAAITDHEPSEARLAEQAAARARDAVWVLAAVSGDPDAFGQLYDAWFDRVFGVVHRIVRDRNVAEEVCQDAFLSAWRALDGLEDPGAFGGWLLRIARNAAFNRSDREGRSRPVDREAFAVIEGIAATGAAAPAGFAVTSRVARADDPDAAVADRAVAALVHEVADSLGSRDAEVLDLQLRYDLTPAEVGEVVGLNRNAANQLCHRVRSRFATAFGARMLWNGARPACEELQQALAAAGVDAFGPEAVAIAHDHARSCPDCEERRRTRLAPAALFAALPVLAAPDPVRAGVAAALSSAGVPMRGSTAGAPSPAAASASIGSSLPPAPAGSGVASLRRSVLVAAAVVALLVLSTAFLLARDGGGDGDPLAAGGDRSTTTTTASTSARAGGEGSPTTAGAVVGVDPGSTTTTTAPAATTTQLPSPTIELLTLEPADPQPTTYPLGPGSPTLRWAVADASEVEVWQDYDDGVSGTRPQRIVSTDPTGELQVCPGTTNPDQTCTAPAGTYSYRIEATNPTGDHLTSLDVSLELYVVIT